jgi:aminoglycoside phosphotransferase (APT) family kinase protein
MTSRTPGPTEDDATRILTELMGAEVQWLERFPTGLAHYVYDALLADGRRLVARLTRPEQAGDFAGAVYWYHRLKPLGVPLPDLLHFDVSGGRHGFPAMIMERLPGADLGQVYASLSRSQLRFLAGWVVDLQRCVAELPPGPGFGYASSYGDPSLKAGWRAVLDENLERSRQRIQAAGVVDPEAVDRVQALLDSFDPYVSSVEPTCFLHDTTTKNVIIDHGAPTGIVDVDTICLGDPLFTPALTHMALLSRNYDTYYIDAWLSALNLTARQRAATTLYTAIHCAAFLSELGQPFNSDHAPDVDPGYRRHLLATLDRLLAEID